MSIMDKNGNALPTEFDEDDYYALKEAADWALKALERAGVNTAQGDMPTDLAFLKNKAGKVIQATEILKEKRGQ